MNRRGSTHLPFMPDDSRFTPSLMSYHILHQFDEQWLADLNKEGGDGPKMRRLLERTDADSRATRRAKLFSAREARRWAVVAASTLLAVFALLFALDASRRADALQQRLDSIETTVKAR